MAVPHDGSRRHDDVSWPRSQVQNGNWPDFEEEEEPALYRTDEFRTKVMKVLRCSKKYCHDWTRCPFAHPGEKATRRDPMLGIYTGIACPDMKKDQRCPRGSYCPYAHNVFEYWLHPTRYRTALCRDVERCQRKICFFAHDASEIRSGVDRPYVSPEQLVAATEMAAADPRVQAEYNAAGEEQRRSSKPGLMTGLFNSLDDSANEREHHATEQLQNMNLSLIAPPPSDESEEVRQALSTLMRGAMGPISNPYAAGPPAGASGWHRGPGTYQNSLHSGPDTPGSSILTGPGGLPSLNQQRLRRISSDPSARQPLGGPSSSLSTHDADLLRQASLAQSVSTIDEMAPTMFASHLNTMPHTASYQSRGSQQNFANAAAHLMMDASGHEHSIWSTPVSPLDQLYSNASASTNSERQSSLEAQKPIALETAYRQKLQKRNAERQARETAAANAYRNGGFGLSNLYTHAGLQTRPPSRDAMLHSGQSAYGTWSLAPNLDFQRAIQQQQAAQTHAYLRSLHESRLMQQQQQAQHAQQQQIFEQMGKLQMAIQTELRHSNQSGGGFPIKPQQAPAPVETGFDLRFGGLGEAQGLLTQTSPERRPAAHPNLLHTTATTYFSDFGGGGRPTGFDPNILKRTSSADFQGGGERPGQAREEAEALRPHSALPTHRELGESSRTAAAAPGGTMEESSFLDRGGPPHVPVTSINA